MTKLSKSAFMGIINDACHQFTLGKESSDVSRCIELLQNKIDDFQQILDSRSKTNDDVAVDCSECDGLGYHVYDNWCARDNRERCDACGGNGTTKLEDSYKYPAFEVVQKWALDNDYSGASDDEAYQAYRKAHPCQPVLGTELRQAVVPEKEEPRGHTVADPSASIGATDNSHYQASGYESRVTPSQPKQFAPDITTMVSRFLGWTLPKDFAPDAGISFNPVPNSHGDPYPWPTGTNLFHAEQARKMFEYVLQDSNDAIKPPQSKEELVNLLNLASSVLDELNHALNARSDKLETLYSDTELSNLKMRITLVLVGLLKS